MEFLVTFVRTLTREEVIIAPTEAEARKLAEIRYGELENADFDQAEGEIDVEELSKAAE